MLKLLNVNKEGGMPSSLNWSVEAKLRCVLAVKTVSLRTTEQKDGAVSLQYGTESLTLSF